MKRELIVTAEGTDRSIVIEGPLPDGRFRVTVDGTVHEVDARLVRPGTWSLILEGRSYVVDLDTVAMVLPSARPEPVWLNPRS